MSAPTVLVVDDEPLARRRAIRILKQSRDFAVILEAGDIVEAGRLLETSQIDVLLLDVQMPGGTGFELLETISGQRPAIVFVTAFDDWALRAFEASALDYITKPIDPGRLRAALDRALAAVRARSDQDRIAELTETVHALRQSVTTQQRSAVDFWVKVRGEFVRIPSANISRFQADGDYVQIHAGNESFLHHESLTSLMRRLDANAFMRVHRSTIVRKSAVARVRQEPFSTLIIILVDGTEIRVGRTYASAVRATLNRPAHTAA